MRATALVASDNWVDHAGMSQRAGAHQDAAAVDFAPLRDAATVIIEVLRFIAGPQAAPYEDR
ncbi:hypothetical protein [Catenulispora yoronensis]